MREGIIMDPQYLVNLFLMQDSQYLLYMLYYVYFVHLRSTSSTPEPTLNLDLLDARILWNGPWQRREWLTPWSRGMSWRRSSRWPTSSHATSQRSKWTNSQICCLWLYFCDIYASPKSSMQGVFSLIPYDLWFCRRTLTIQSNTSRIFDVSAVFVTFHSSFHILRSLVYHGSRSMAEWHLNLKASIEPEAVPGQWILMRWIWHADYTMS